MSKISEFFSSECCPLSAKAKTRKQQAIADRELELLAIAKQMFTKEGFSNLTMDRVAAASSYSKGTVYNHFCSKEDLVSALGSQAMRHELTLFRRAVTYDGNSRERLLALHVAYYLYSRMEPVMSMCVINTRTPWVIEKTSQARLEEMQVLELEMMGLFDALVQEAIEEKSISLSAGQSIDSIIFSNWAMAFGSNALMNKQAVSSQLVDRMLARNSVLTNTNVVLDGLGWLPLSAEWDYNRSWVNIEQTLFSAEMAHLESSLIA
ncbi:TetR/AcrR family transcriptional regulator [Thaumasiovibrio subtropicus]|uniref:TetR/AcrR family transcriptional regulator n=1 Tax=Thaumasiovibrio subtropicus TaxID=1891207 RepID=UPI000B34C7F5|nr:TetR/AcrR family transcriptional regulator [Thaumasiovibrio subtropicus]